METYKIRMNVEMASWTESPAHEPVEREDESLELTIAEDDASNIDACERARFSENRVSIRSQERPKQGLIRYEYA